MSATIEPLSVGLLLFLGFEVLDVAGPIEVLNMLYKVSHPSLTLSVIAQNLDTVSPAPVEADHSSPFLSAQMYQPTCTMDDVPQLDLLIVPGGMGLRRPRAELQPYIDFIAAVYNGSRGKPPIKHLFSICTGSVLFAMAGVLDDRQATSNKRAWPWVTSHGPRTHWLARARWVHSDNIWTTSGVSAGIDGMLAFVASIYGESIADEVCQGMEHGRIHDANNDLWALMRGCEDVPPVHG